MSMGALLRCLLASGVLLLQAAEAERTLHVRPAKKAPKRPPKLQDDADAAANATDGRGDMLLKWRSSIRQRFLAYAVGAGAAQFAFRSGGPSGIGVVDKQEFTAGARAWAEKHSGDSGESQIFGQIVELYEDLFDLSDVNGDGELSVEEQEYAMILQRVATPIGSAVGAVEAPGEGGPAKASAVKNHSAEDAEATATAAAAAAPPREAEGAAPEPPEAEEGSAQVSKRGGLVSVFASAEGDDFHYLPGPAGDLVRQVERERRRAAQAGRTDRFRFTVGLDFASELLEEHDRNHDGVIDKEEFKQGMWQFAKSWKWADCFHDPDMVEYRENLWKKVDMNGDGVLTRPEVHFLALRLDRAAQSGTFSDKALLQVMFRDLDRYPRDNKISFDELSHRFEKENLPVKKPAPPKVQKPRPGPLEGAGAVAAPRFSQWDIMWHVADKFKEADADGDGRLSKEEVAPILGTILEIID